MAGLASFSSLFLVNIPMMTIYRHMSVEEIQERQPVPFVLQLFISKITKNIGYFWSILGTFWLIEEWQGCKERNITLWRYAVAIIFTGWTLLGLFCFCACFYVIFCSTCAPCLLWILRISRILEQRPPALTKTQIKEVAPEYSYDPEQEHSTTTPNYQSISEGSNVTPSNVATTVECAICMENLVAGACVRKLHCKHTYHSKCLAQWLELNSTCPLCRNYSLSPKQETTTHNTVETSEHTTVTILPPSLPSPSPNFVRLVEEEVESEREQELERARREQKRGEV